MRTLWSATCLFLCGAITAHAVERTFIKSGDLTGDGIAETVTIHITGKAIDAPFVWAVTVKDHHGATVYRLRRNDAWLNGFFADEGYMVDCIGQVACKEKYYFQEIPQAIFSAFKAAKEPWIREDLMPILRDTAREYLKKKGISSSRQAIAIEEMIKIVSVPGYHTLVVPYSAVQYDPPMVWVPSVRLFLPYYAE